MYKAFRRGPRRCRAADSDKLYFRAKAGDTARPFSSLQLPLRLQQRLDDLQLVWGDLPGIDQRALLWDSGFALSPTNEVIQIWPLGGWSMVDLAVPLVEFQAVGCVEINCTQTDNTTSLSNLFCNGEQMVNAARCAVEDFIDKSDTRSAMWKTGGNPEVVPTSLIMRHIWKDGGSNISYDVAAIHTVGKDDEAAYGECTTKEQNKGFGSRTLPCLSVGKMSEEAKTQMQEVEGSDWVSRWLVEAYGTQASDASSSNGGNTIILVLLIPIIAGSQATVDDTETASRRLAEEALKRNSTFERDFSSESNEHLVEKRIPFENIRFDRAISKGVNGEVWVGEYSGRQVAIKRLLQARDNRAEDVEEFSIEIELSANLVHPNNVTFIGVAWNTLNNLVMVLEYFPAGDLLAYLVKNEDLLTWAQDKLGIAVGVARAVRYLHSQSPPLIHRDLKSKNIMLTRKLEPKLIDFGVSRGRHEHSMTAGVGTPYWSAPEILEEKRYTEQTDIYSFGVVLSELDTGKLPYHDALTPDGKKPKPFHILSDVIA
ncbi:hypothetical protein PHYSODRAFT_253201 [Phytophthora sojae]|uniref:Protein kinase domain-containing protein n=1 Tax=Phytophthora sojae (strain P6497) TaxID=1094619 RepID=G4YRQ7_PHYSP|nr:hypothetical protein PHYSODRAFT_253201 [Phytophthora sojae]EGZ24098.1 hypothetical protein PHYSODRAFT_253201 [Phytophthora sojae]|eukprot:XP_009519386.1 hypothetical protein PHYSODRAFT_253201 [Phytophthora sojae]